MKDYTTDEAAQNVGLTSADSVRKFAKAHLEEGVGYKKFGRTMVITEKGMKALRERNTKPGPKGSSKTNGSKAK
jgi:hypothetical protein